jgi:hypothetical protein
MSDQRRNIVDAIDALRFDAIADLADLAELSELQDLGEFVPQLDARGQAEQALEKAERIARDANRALGAALNDYRCKRDAYGAAKRALEALA